MARLTAAAGRQWSLKAPARPAVGPLLVVCAAATGALALTLGAGPINLHDEARRTLAITVLGLGLWGAFPTHAFWPSVLIAGLVLASRSLAAPTEVADQVVGLYGTSGVWTPLTGFVLAHAVGVSGLGRRMACHRPRSPCRWPSPSATRSCCR